MIYNQTTDLGQGPFTSSRELFKTLIQWKMPKVSKKETFQKSKEVIISILNFCLFPLWTQNLSPPKGFENRASSWNNTPYIVSKIFHTLLQPFPLSDKLSRVYYT